MKRTFTKALIVTIALAVLMLSSMPRLEARQIGWQYEPITIETLLSFTPELKKLAREIEKYCPPQECYYIGIGRSPTPIMALLEAKYGSSRVINLPLTSMGHSNEAYSYNLYYQKHFAQFLPNADELNNGKMLLIDFVHTGLSLTNSLELVRKHLVYSFGIDEAVSRDKVKALGFAATNFAQVDYKVVKISEELDQGFEVRSFKDLAKYVRFDEHLFADGQSYYEPPKLQSPSLKGETYSMLVEAFQRKLECERVLNHYLFRPSFVL